MKKLIFLIFISSCFRKNLVSRGDPEINSSLIEKCSEEELNISIENDDTYKLENLFKNGLRINKEYKGKSLLVRSFELKKNKVFRYLILKGAILTKEFDEDNFSRNIDEIFYESIDKVKLNDIESILKGRDEFPKIISLKDLRYLQKFAVSKIFEKSLNDKLNEEESKILNKIKSGANINEICIEDVDNFVDGLTAEGTFKIMEEFFSRYEGDINFTDSEGRTLLSRFLEETTNINVIKKLLEVGANPNNLKELEYSPLNLYIANLNVLKDKSLEEDLINKTERIDVLEKSLETLENKEKSLESVEAKEKDLRNKISFRKNEITNKLKV